MPRVAVEAVVLRVRAGLGEVASLTAIQALGVARRSARMGVALATGAPMLMSPSRATPLKLRSVRRVPQQLNPWLLQMRLLQLPQRLSPRSPS